MENKYKVFIGTGLGLLVGAGAGITVSTFNEPEPEVIVETINNTITEEVEVVKEVKVDNENLSEVLEYAYENEGNLSLVTDGLKEEEIDEVVDRIDFINNVEKEAVELVNNSILNRIDARYTNLDLVDMSRLEVNETANFSGIDFDFKDITVKVDGEFEHDKDLYNFTVPIEFRDGEFYKWGKVIAIKQ